MIRPPSVATAVQSAYRGTRTPISLARRRPGSRTFGSNAPAMPSSSDSIGRPLYSPGSVLLLPSLIVLDIPYLQPLGEAPRRGLKWPPERVNMLVNASSRAFHRNSISVTSCSAETGFVNTGNRICHLTCERNYQGSNPLRHFLAASMFYQKRRFCPRFGAFWPIWPTKSVKGGRAGRWHPGTVVGAIRPSCWGLSALVTAR